MQHVIFFKFNIELKKVLYKHIYAQGFKDYIVDIMNNQFDD